MQDQSRQYGGDETWCRLQNWTKEQKVSERLAGCLLQSEGYSAIDPSHPLGGKDGGKDLILKKDDLTLIGAVFFPRGQQTFASIKKKFTSDLEGVAKNNADGLVFVTNQELKLGERKKLQDVKQDVVIDLYHLERLTLLLNTPKNYGVRFEFLDMHITEPEYLSFLADRDEQHYRRFQKIDSNLTLLLQRIEKQAADMIGYATGGDSFAYFQPVVLMGTKVVHFMLVNLSEYPVFDIHAHYIDPDEKVDFAAGRFYTHKGLFSLVSLYPTHYVGPVWLFDMNQTEKISIQAIVRVRTNAVVQQFRLFQQAGKVVVARKTVAGNKTIECDVPETVPNYDPADPESVFRHKPP